METSKIEKAYKILLKESWKIVKKRTHKNDLNKRKIRYKIILKNFENEPMLFVNDAIEDITALYDW